MELPMIVCPACHHPMLGTPVTCDACGKLLPRPDANEDTLVVEKDALKITPKPQKVWQSAQVGKGRTIKAHIAKVMLTITLTAEKATTLGRTVETHEKSPDVDLTEYDAWENGVSRLHAALRLQQSDIVLVKDLESANGTFLNGQQVTPNQWRIVRDKDELRLGTLVMTLHFN